MNSQRRSLFRLLVNNLSHPQILAVYAKALIYKGWNLLLLDKERQELYDREWELLMDELLVLGPEGILIPRSVRLAIYRLAFSLMVSSTFSIYLFLSIGPHLMLVPLTIGLLAMNSVFFHFAAKWVQMMNYYK